MMKCSECLSYSVCEDEDKGCAICGGYEPRVLIEKKVCCLCGKEFMGWGNNPWPVDRNEGAVCCDDCNETKVLEARIRQMYRK